jgi:hypothetical protein
MVEALYQGRPAVSATAAPRRWWPAQAQAKGEVMSDHMDDLHEKFRKMSSEELREHIDRMKAEPGMAAMIDRFTSPFTLSSFKPRQMLPWTKRA